MKRPSALAMFQTILVFVGLAGLAGCRPDAGTSTQDPSSSEDTTMTFTLTSSAFDNGDPIPKKYTSITGAEDVSPALSWSGVPDEAKQLVIICDDPDAPTAEPWVHWVIYNIPVDLGGLPEGVPADEEPKDVPGALQGNNTWPTIGYKGPAPPSGTHRYFFKAYAVPAGLFSEPGLDKKAVLAAIDGKVIAQAELMGTYER